MNEDTEHLMILEMEYFRELDEIALRVYGKRFNNLCEPRKKTIETLHATGDF